MIPFYGSGVNHRQVLQITAPCIPLRGTMKTSEVTRYGLRGKLVIQVRFIAQHSVIFQSGWDKASRSLISILTIAPLPLTATGPRFASRSCPTDRSYTLSCEPWTSRGKEG